MRYNSICKIIEPIFMLKNINTHIGKKIGIRIGVIDKFGHFYIK